MNFLGQDLFQWLRPSVFLGVPTEELPPLVNELFGREHLERYARDLGAAHAEVRRGGRNSLLVRLADNEHFTAEATTALTDLIICGGRVPPAGEWLIDNHFLVVEQVRIARLHLPRSYSWELPLLLKGPDAGLPRVYVLALEFITHVDGCVDSDMLRAFLNSYQSRRVLTMGELWGIPIMLRLALVENVRRVAARLVHFVTDNAAARVWAERMIAEAENAPHQVILIVADLARSGQELSSPFVAELRLLKYLLITKMFLSLVLYSCAVGTKEHPTTFSLAESAESAETRRNSQDKEKRSQYPIARGETSEKKNLVFCAPKGQKYTSLGHRPR